MSTTAPIKKLDPKQKKFVEENYLLTRDEYTKKVLEERLKKWDKKRWYKMTFGGANTGYFGGYWGWKDIKKYLQSIPKAEKDKIAYIEQDKKILFSFEPHLSVVSYAKRSGMYDDAVTAGTIKKSDADKIIASTGLAEMCDGGVMMEDGATMKDGGGGITNQYEGKTPKQVWDDWDLLQRVHFLSDHNEHDVEMNEIGKMAQYEYDDLLGYFKHQLGSHVRTGQYGDGGSDIINQYLSGDENFPLKTPKEVWTAWNESQRDHFIEDHKDRINLKYDRHNNQHLTREKYDELPSLLQNQLSFHIQSGQYADGGSGEVDYVEYRDALKRGGFGRLHFSTFQERSKLGFPPTFKFKLEKPEGHKEFYSEEGLKNEYGHLVMADGGSDELGVNKKGIVKRSESNPRKWIFTITWADLVNGEKVWRKYPNHVSEYFDSKKAAEDALAKQMVRSDELAKMAKEAEAKEIHEKLSEIDLGRMGDGGSYIMTKAEKTELLKSLIRYNERHILNELEKDLLSESKKIIAEGADVHPIIMKWKKYDHESWAHKKEPFYRDFASSQPIFIYDRINEILKEKYNKELGDKFILLLEFGQWGIYLLHEIPNDIDKIHGLIAYGTIKNNKVGEVYIIKNGKTEQIKMDDGGADFNDWYRYGKDSQNSFFEFINGKYQKGDLRYARKLFAKLSSRQKQEFINFAKEKGYIEVAAALTERMADGGSSFSRNNGYFIDDLETGGHYVRQLDDYTIEASGHIMRRINFLDSRYYIE